MNNKLIVSSDMSLMGEDDVIRMLPSDITFFGAEVGGVINVKDKKGNPLSLRIELAPAESTLAPSYFLVSYSTYLKLGGDTHKVSLGCDPEFVFIDAIGRVCRADSFLPHLGKMGSDGPLAELRPEPAYREIEVVENLRKLIKSIPRLLEEKTGKKNVLTPQAHSEKSNQAMGFHIHFGAPSFFLGKMSLKRGLLITDIASVLDYYLAIPAMLLEEGNNRRLGEGRYGKPTDWRRGPGTIEYRTLGGFHLRHPDFACGIMGLGLLVVKEVIAKMEEDSFGFRTELPENYRDCLARVLPLPNREEVEKILRSKDKSDGFRELPKIVKALEAMKNFKVHQTSIKTYFGHIVNDRPVNPNILENW
jgi:hypothetical protein